MLNKTRGINQQDFKIVDPILSNINHFHSLQVVNRVNETHLQVDENRSKGSNSKFINVT